jgi:hypothetical protein
VSQIAMRRGVAGDLYLVLAGYDVQTQVGSFKMFINPLVNWIWLGVGIMVFGSFIALLPERTFAFAMAKVPSGAATTTVLLLALLGGYSVSLRAQHVETPNLVIVPPRSPVEKEMQTAIICMCGTCGRKKVGECTCEKAAEMRDEIAKLAAAGKSRDEIIQYFIGPYAAGVVGIGVAGGMAIRWSRKSHTGTDAGPRAVTNPALESQLDHELQDLD